MEFLKTIIKTIKIKVTKSMIRMIKINTKIIANNYLIINRLIIKNNNKTFINKYIRIIENKSQLLFKFFEFGA